MSLYQKILNKETNIAIVGLGYVGITLAVAFAEKAHVIGYDIDERKIMLYKSGVDPTDEVGNEAIKNTDIRFTYEPDELKKACFFIITVPTPLTRNKKPDLTCIINASTTVAKHMPKGSVIVYESTVYPGATESVCIPVLEKESGLKCGVDFNVGYSPERINPGDRINRLESIVKIVSATDADTLAEIKDIYNMIINAGTYAVSNIMTAEAVKDMENTQRDFNIALMNDFAMILNLMHIDTNEAADAMDTKWNALGFRPGLVGGHCIGIDSHYFMYEAARLGYQSQLMSISRQINDYMGYYIADTAMLQMTAALRIIRGAKAAVLGVTFKENCPDIRNSRVFDIIFRLKSHAIDVDVVDPRANPAEVRKVYDIELKALDDINNVDCVIFAVSHDEFREISVDRLDKLFRVCNNDNKIIIDVKGILDKTTLNRLGYRLWRL
ncbi:MAG: nucleotide sugar dehydrogenase [Eubacteriales bacterium]|jgi:UDP-N-acetyl-D-galactosamine dehydrogenase|nr:nucleotide sugar dehydrogenase [Eubacteriales bacterium]